MKDEFSKLAYIPCILWGKRKIGLISHKPHNRFYKYIWYKYIFSDLQVLQMTFSCLKNVINSCLVLLLCEIYFSENDTLIFILFNCFLSPSLFKRPVLPSRFGDDFIWKISNMGLECSCGSRCIWNFTLVSVKTFSGSIVFIVRLWSILETHINDAKTSIWKLLKFFRINILLIEMFQYV